MWIWLVLRKNRLVVSLLILYVAKWATWLKFIVGRLVVPLMVIRGT